MIVQYLFPLFLIKLLIKHRHFHPLVDVFFNHLIAELYHLLVEET